MKNSKLSALKEKLTAKTSMTRLTDNALVDIGLNRQSVEPEDRGQKASDEMSSLWLVSNGCGRLSLRK